MQAVLGRKMIIWDMQYVQVDWGSPLTLRPYMRLKTMSKCNETEVILESMECVSTLHSDLCMNFCSTQRQGEYGEPKQLESFFSEKSYDLTKLQHKLTSALVLAFPCS